MGSSNAERGARYKKRSREWCEEKGYPVATMEIQRVVHTPSGIFPSKRDQWGSDWIYLTTEGATLLQVKGGGKPRTVLIKEAQDKFDQFSFPKNMRLEVHIWRPRARAPEIIECHKTNVL